MEDQPRFYTGDYRVEKEAIINSPGRLVKYPFPMLEIGEVFYEYRDKLGKAKPGPLYSAKRYWEEKLPGRKFSVRVVSIGVKVQRVE